jgi:hypothetical protein
MWFILKLNRLHATFFNEPVILIDINIYKLKKCCILLQELIIKQNKHILITVTSFTFIHYSYLFIDLYHLSFIIFKNTHQLDIF